MLKAGDFIGNYRILSKLGKGGMGDVYKAMQEPLKRVVALKVLPPQLSREDEFAKRFETEAEAFSRLQHQNIVSVYEYGDYDLEDGEGGYRFIAMQFIDGQDLGEYIHENRRVAIAEIINFTKQICRGLLYAHSHNIIHRDIKPSNILLDRKGVLRITDFGIAKGSFTNTGLTQTGSTIGTPEYMSPEQAQGKNIDAQSDVYSLGILMYEMLTDRPPFTANNSMGVAYKQVHEAPTPPSLKRKDTPKLLELVVLKALKKDKLERYKSVEELLADLDKVDLSERADNPTVHIRPAAKQPGRKDTQAQDRRIVDRRSGSADAPVLSRRYWSAMLKTQWLSWLAIAALGAAFAWHVMNG